MSMFGVTIAVVALVLPTSVHTPRRAPQASMQAGNAAAAKAFEMLGRMGMQAATEATPGVMPQTKEFVSSVVIKHDRVIDEKEGLEGRRAKCVSVHSDELAHQGRRRAVDFPASRS